jgi:hypothetical protein
MDRIKVYDDHMVNVNQVIQDLINDIGGDDKIDPKAEAYGMSLIEDCEDMSYNELQSCIGSFIDGATAMIK